jgi:type IV pilus assembly protein PilO
MNPSVERIFDKVLKLPNKQKAALLLLSLLLVGIAFYFGLIKPKYEQFKQLQVKLSDLQNQIQENKKIADNLPKLKMEYEQLKRELEAALTELPNQKEIPSLLTSITNVGKSSGLDFLLFRPKPEQSKDFYSEVPVDIVVSGSFFNVANFFVAVGNLPRIVNINNVAVSDIKDAGGRTMMKVNCLATTFRFLEKKETDDDKKNKKK